VFLVLVLDLDLVDEEVVVRGRDRPDRGLIPEDTGEDILIRDHQDEI